MKRLLLIATIFLISNTALAAASPASCTVTLTSNSSSYLANATVTFTAVVSSCGTIGGVAFYNGAALIGKSIGPTTSGGSSYALSWTPTGTGTYNISASVLGKGGTLSVSGVNSQVIDIVGSSNPVTSTVFGEAGSSGVTYTHPSYTATTPSGTTTVPSGTVTTPSTSSTPWTEGDNQLCVATFSYNAIAPNFPDGTCEWTDSAKAPASLPPPTSSMSTVDSLDDTMHTLSDFVTFANKFLGQNVATLSQSMDTWYPQVAQWIDPNNDGSRGRLLSIYEPSGYPGISGYASTGSTDKLNDWNTVITGWLNNNYTSSSAWCVPAETTASRLEVVSNGATVKTAEAQYIENSSVTTTWGDLGHVIACLNYNAGQNSNGTPVSFNFTSQGATGGPVTLTVGSPAYNYQQCLNLLQTTCPASLAGTVCDPSILGRSLAASDFVGSPAAPPTYSGTHKCDDAYSDSSGPSFAKYVNDSLILATDEAPKFALRAKFLNDVYTRAINMQQMFTSGDAAFQTFFKPCDSAHSGCSSGGPAAQLIYAHSKGNPTATLPNSVIYGWQDNPPLGGSGGGCWSTGLNGQSIRVGCAHLVKVTAYAAGRTGNPSVDPGDDASGFVQSKLPWVKASLPWEIWWNLSTVIPTPIPVPWQSWVLNNRDGYVYVSVKRWDEDHSNPQGGGLVFPNGHQLWQFSFHNPGPNNTTTGTALMQSCNGVELPGCNGTNCNVGFGLGTQTAAALANAGILSQDKSALSSAFMLNDEGGSGSTAGQVDPSATGSTGSLYNACLSKANQLLDKAPESHACAEYIATNDASQSSSAAANVVPSSCWGFRGPCVFGLTPSSGLCDAQCTPPAPTSAEHDYSIKFVDCRDVPRFPSKAPEDLTYKGAVD